MSSESSVQSYRVDALTAERSVSPASHAAWRSTYAAALRVIDHHRANLEARMTIQRLRRDERRPVDDVDGPALHS